MAQSDDFTPTGKSTSGDKITLAEPPDDFTPIQVTPGKNQPLRIFPQGPQQPLTDEAIGRTLNYIRPFVSGGTGILGSTIGGIAGPGGSFTGGVLGYAGPDALMKALNPVESLRPDDNVESFSQSVKDGLVNEIGGRLFEGVFNAGRAIRNAGAPDPASILKLYPTTSQALENYGYHKLAKVAGFMEAYGAPKASAEALDRAGGEGFTQALLLSNRMNSSGKFTKTVFQDPAILKQKILDTLEQGINKQAVAGQFQAPVHYASQDAYDLLKGTDTPFSALDDVMNSQGKLEKVLAVGQAVGPKNLNVRKDLQAYYWNRIFDEATTTAPNGTARIDPDIINQNWFNPKSGQLTKNLETLYGKQTKANLDDFMQNVIDAQTHPVNLAGGLMPKIKYYGKGFGLSGLLTALGAGAAGPIAASGLYLTNATMGRLLTNPNVGKAVIDMLKAGPLSTTNKVLARGIFSALEGSRIALMDNQNSKTWGSVQRQPDGSYQFVKE